MMEQITAKTISNAIKDTYFDGIIKVFTKKGFVNMDGSILRYNPLTYEFNVVNQTELHQYINGCDVFKWTNISNKETISRLKKGLPQISQLEADHFHKYIVQDDKETQMNMIKTKLEPYLKDYEQYKGRQTSIKGIYDIENQVIILKQNNFILDHNEKTFYQYSNGTIKKIAHPSVITYLFDDYLEKGIDVIPYYKVKQNINEYMKYFPNAHKLIEFICENMGIQSTYNFGYVVLENNQNNAGKYKKDYNKILKLIKTYGIGD